MFQGDDRIGIIGAFQPLKCVFGLREDFEPLALPAEMFEQMTDMRLSQPRRRRIWAGDLPGKLHDGTPVPLALIVYTKVVIGVRDSFSDFRLDVGLISETLIHSRRCAVEQFTHGNDAFGRV